MGPLSKLSPFRYPLPPQVKPPQRESELELMGLPVGGYLVRVRCRSHNYGLWSEWSSPLQMTIPARPLAGTQG